MEGNRPLIAQHSLSDRNCENIEVTTVEEVVRDPLFELDGSITSCTTAEPPHEEPHELPIIHPSSSPSSYAVLPYGYCISCFHRQSPIIVPGSQPATGSSSANSYENLREGLDATSVRRPIPRLATGPVMLSDNHVRLGLAEEESNSGTAEWANQHGIQDQQSSAISSASSLPLQRPASPTLTTMTEDTSCDHEVQALSGLGVTGHGSPPQPTVTSDNESPLRTFSSTGSTPSSWPNRHSSRGERPVAIVKPMRPHSSATAGSLPQHVQQQPLRPSSTHSGTRGTPGMREERSHSLSYGIMSHEDREARFSQLLQELAQDFDLRHSPHQTSSSLLSQSLPGAAVGVITRAISRSFSPPSNSVQITASATHNPLPSWNTPSISRASSSQQSAAFISSSRSATPHHVGDSLTNSSPTRTMTLPESGTRSTSSSSFSQQPSTIRLGDFRQSIDATSRRRGANGCW